jgi:hypothetical protein
MNNEFDLQRAVNGEPIETVSGTSVEFIAYRPTARECKQLIVQAGTDVRMYYANGRYHSPNEHWSYDLRMKSKLKKIDWTKLPVDTLLTLDLCKVNEERYFSSFRHGMVHFFLYGATSKTADSKLDVLTVKPSNVKIAQDQPWTIWQGGECPIPDGLEYEVITRGGAAPFTNRGCYQVILWSYTQNGVHSMSEIIAYRLTGKVLDGYLL